MTAKSVAARTSKWDAHERRPISLKKEIINIGGQIHSITRKDEALGKPKGLSMMRLVAGAPGRI